MLTRALLLGFILAIPYFTYQRLWGSPTYEQMVQQTLDQHGYVYPEFYGSGLKRCGAVMYGVEFTAWTNYELVPVSGAVCCGFFRCEVNE